MPVLIRLQTPGSRLLAGGFDWGLLDDVPMILTPPVFIAEGHDVMVFRDAAAAELWLEEIDVDRAPG